MGYHVRVSPPGAGFLSFDTLADLAAFPAAVFVPGLIVYVATPNTVWVFNPSSTATATGTDAASTVVAAVGGGNWIRVAAIEYDALLFGASAANADNATAINAAIVQANTDGGGDVVLPEGTFTCLSTINLLSNVTLRGSGTGTVLNQAGAAAACVLVNGQSYCSLKSLDIQSTGDGLDLSAHAGNSNGFVAEDVSVLTWGATNIGIAFYVDTNANNIKFPRFRNVSAYNQTPQPGSTAIGTVGSLGSVISASWVAGRVSGSGLGISLGASSESAFSDLEFDNIVNQGVAVAISAVNVGTAVFTTGAPHGLTVGQLVTITAPGVTGLPATATAQIATTPLETTFTIYGVSSFGGVYAGGGDVTPANGLAISLGAGAAGNFFKNIRIEDDAIFGGFVSCNVSSTSNTVELSAKLSPLFSQMLDASGTNILYGSNGAGGFIDTNPQPLLLSGVQLGGLLGAASVGHIAAPASGTLVLDSKLQFGLGTLALISQVTETTTIQAASVNVTPQTSTFAGGNNGGGGFQLNFQAPTGSGAEAILSIFRGGVFSCGIGPYPGAGATNASLFLAPNITPNGSNHSIQSSATVTAINSPTSTGTVNISNGNSGLTCASFKQSTGCLFGLPIGGVVGTLTLNSVTIPLTSGANVALTNAQASNPNLKFTGTLSGAGTTVTFPSADASFPWQCDFSAVVFGVNSVALIANGVTWSGAANITATATTQFPVVRYTNVAAKLVGHFDTP